MVKFHYRESPTPEQKKSFAPYLSEDEDLVLVTSLSRAHLRSKFMMYLLFPGLLVLGLVLGLGWVSGIGKIPSLILSIILMFGSAVLKTMHIYHANRYLLTTKRVIIKKGLFSVKLTAALYDKITHIEVEQGFTDRLLFHHGTVNINTAGQGQISLKFIDYPLEVKNLLERLINREREQLGMRAQSTTTLEGEIVEQ